MSKISVLGEIERFSKEKDKPILIWLLDMVTRQEVWDVLVDYEFDANPVIYKATKELIELSKGINNAKQIQIN